MRAYSVVCVVGCRLTRIRSTAICEAGHAKMSKDLAKCPPELRVADPEQSKRLRPTGRKPGVVVGHGYAGAARRRRGAKGCSGSRVARGATRTRGLASASDSRASRHVHKSYELLACNAALREGAAPSRARARRAPERRAAVARSSRTCAGHARGPRPRFGERKPRPRRAFGHGRAAKESRRPFLPLANGHPLHSNNGRGGTRRSHPSAHPVRAPTLCFLANATP